MTTADALIAELKQEAGTTRRVLERIPEGELDWKPHPKSMSLGQLALHLATLPRGIAQLLDAPTAAIPTVRLPEATSVRQILTALDESVGAAAARLTTWGDEGLRADWTLKQGAETVLTLPRGTMARTLLMNHSYHHRGQLTVYLRLLDVPLPPVYGDTADEPFTAS